MMKKPIPFNSNVKGAKASLTTLAAMVLKPVSNETGTSYNFARSLTLLAMFMFSSLYADYDKKVKLPTVSFPMAADESFKVMQRNCQWCHSYGYILNQGRQSREFWHKVVIKMRDVYKAPISQMDEKAATDYLFKYYGNSKLK